jgi:hypothetical protein
MSSALRVVSLLAWLTVEDVSETCRQKTILLKCKVSYEDMKIADYSIETECPR